MRLTVISLVVMAVLVCLLLGVEGKRDKSRRGEIHLRRDTPNRGERGLGRGQRGHLRNQGRPLDHRHLLPVRGRQHAPPGRPRRPGGRRSNMRAPFRRRLGLVRPLIDMVSWDRKVDGIAGVTERAILNSDKQTVLLFSMDSKLAGSNITRSVALFDFKTSMAAVKIRVNTTRLCVILPSSVLTSNFSDVNNTLHNRNGTVDLATPDTGSYIMKGSDKMTAAQVKDLQTTHEQLYFFCGQKSIVNINATQGVDGSTDKTNTKELSVLTLGGKTNIFLKSTISL